MCTGCESLQTCNTAGGFAFLCMVSNGTQWQCCAAMHSSYNLGNIKCASMHELPLVVAALYTLEGEPWLLDARAGRPDDLLPTVLALWRLPALLPAVPLRHAAVSHFILSEL